MSVYPTHCLWDYTIYIPNIFELWQKGKQHFWRENSNASVINNPCNYLRITLMKMTIFGAKNSNISVINNPSNYYLWIIEQKWQFLAWKFNFFCVKQSMQSSLCLPNKMATFWRENSNVSVINNICNYLHITSKNYNCWHENSNAF